MLKIFILDSFIILFVAVNSIFGQPKLPYKDFGAEPCEYCQYGKWVATKATPIFKTMKRDSPVAFHVKSKEQVTAITGIVITTKAGLGKTVKNTYLEYFDEKNNRQIKIPIKKGNKFYLLTYHGEDVYSVWFKGRILIAKLSNDLLEIRRPKSVWWVKIRNSKGQVGWTQMARNFDGEHTY